MRELARVSRFCRMPELSRANDRPFPTASNRDIRDAQRRLPGEGSGSLSRT